MKHFLLNLMSLLVSFNIFSATQFDFTTQSGTVEFKTKGWPNLVNIKGEGEGLEGSLTQIENKVSGILAFNLNSLKTGISLRDDHMKNKYLQVNDFPKAELILKDLVLPPDLKGEFEFKGELKLHGVTKEISGKANLLNNSNQMTLKAEVPIVLTDFKIEIPSYQGITVADKVSILIESKVDKKE